MLETLDYTIRIGSTQTFLYFDLYLYRLYSVYAAHYIYFTYWFVNILLFRSIVYCIGSVFKSIQIKICLNTYQIQGLMFQVII